MASVLVLDIDGILVSHGWWKRRPGKATNEMTQEEHDLFQIDPDAVETLNQVVEQCGIELIVLSSTWRITHTSGQMTRLLRQKGFRPRITYNTPRLTMNWLREDSPAKSMLGTSSTGVHLHDYGRGMEIEILLQQLFKTREERLAIQLVILDDDSDMGRLLPWLVQTSFASGLLPNHIAMCQDRLNKPLGELLVNRHPWLIDGEL